MKNVILLCVVLGSVAACAPPMKWTKVSELPSASLPMSGTETVMIVQDGKSVRVSVADLKTYFSLRQPQ